MNDDSEMKKAKRAKKSALKRGLGLKVTKIACLTTCDRITTYPHGTNAFKVCESEMLSKIQRKI